MDFASRGAAFEGKLRPAIDERAQPGAFDGSFRNSS